MSAALHKRYGIKWRKRPCDVLDFWTEDTLRDALEFARNNRLPADAYLVGSIGRGAYSDKAVSDYARKRFEKALARCG